MHTHFTTYWINPHAKLPLTLIQRACGSFKRRHLSRNEGVHGFGVMASIMYWSMPLGAA